jgi:hypothetical protein
MGGAGQIPEVAQRVGVKIVAGPMILGSEHEAVAIVEADSAEAVHEFTLQSGLVQWNSVRVSVARPLPEALTEMERMPPPLY